VEQEKPDQHEPKTDTRLGFLFHYARVAAQKAKAARKKARHATQRAQGAWRWFYKLSPANKFGAIVAVATTTYTIVAWRQLSAMNDALVAQQRAWVLPVDDKPIGFTAFPKEARRRYYLDAVWVPLKNFGSGPAFEVTTAPEMFFTGETLPPGRWDSIKALWPWSLYDLVHWEAGTDGPKPSIVLIGPGQTVYFPFRLFVHDRNGAKALRHNGGLRMIVYIYYRDMFGKSRLTRTAFLVKRSHGKLEGSILPHLNIAR
jgi:hypothetical protein